MSVYDIVGKTEDHPIYKRLEASNRDRQYSFLESAVRASLDLNTPHLTLKMVRALNHHAIAQLHVSPGQFRHEEVEVGGYVPPPAYMVEDLMGNFISKVLVGWDAMQPISMGAFVLWSINSIHPFRNGNGRTARAACHFVICTKFGSWLGGQPILPELIRANRPLYVSALKEADNGNLTSLTNLIADLLLQQVSGSPSRQ